eukprot:jgi/Chlat1/573/Chrsp103S01137
MAATAVAVAEVVQGGGDVVVDGNDDAMARVMSAIGRTSLFVAAGRAHESRRSDALFRDVLAEALADAAAAEPDDNVVNVEEHGHVGPHQPHLLAFVATRTRYLDDQMLAALSTEPHPKQIVILGSGMDARPWRLSPPSGVPLPDLAVDVDQAHILDAKSSFLSRLALPLTLARKHVAVPMDLRNPTFHNILSPSPNTLPTLWLMEGLVRFFTADQMDDIVRAAAEVSAPGSVLLVTVPSAEEAHRMGVNVGDNNNNNNDANNGSDPRWRFTCNNPRAWFSRHGWVVTEVKSAKEVREMYGREVVGQVGDGDWVVNKLLFVTCRKEGGE